MGCVHPSRHRPTKHYAVVLRPAKHVALNEVLSGEAQAAADKLDIESLSPHVTVGRICSKNEEMLKIKFREMAQKVQVSSNLHSRCFEVVVRNFKLVERSLLEARNKRNTHLLLVK